MSSPRASAALAVRLSTRMLPAGGVRDRYRQELVAELYDIDKARQLRYAARVMARAWSLRRAVTEENTMETEHATTKTRPLHCRLHLWHHYRTASTEDGQLYRRCVDCGKEKTGDIDPEGPSMSGRGMIMPV